MIERRRQELKSLAMAAKNSGDKVSLADYPLHDLQIFGLGFLGAKLLYEPVILHSLTHLLSHGCNCFSI